jgi:hypothetical protein
VLSLTFSYVIYPVNNNVLSFYYNLVSQPDFGSYQLQGPVGFLSNNDLTFSQWVVGNRYITCTGCNSTALSVNSCILTEDCINNNGNVINSSCIFCPAGIMFQNGACSKVCGPNQVFNNNGCACMDGFTRDGPNCVNIAK